MERNLLLRTGRDKGMISRWLRRYSQIFCFCKFINRNTLEVWSLKLECLALNFAVLCDLKSPGLLSASMDTLFCYLYFAHCLLPTSYYLVLPCALRPLPLLLPDYPPVSDIGISSTIAFRDAGPSGEYRAGHARKSQVSLTSPKFLLRYSAISAWNSPKLFVH